MPINTDGKTATTAAESSALACASISTSEQLVKTLRIPQPPPNGVRKIDIALEAWHSNELYVPQKAELLSQWALGYLCSSLKSSSSAAASGPSNKGKNKAKQQQQQHIPTSTVELDSKAWMLLSNIIATQIGTGSDLSGAAKRSWLSHLANTQPVLTLSGSFARHLSQDTSLSLEERQTLLSVASASLEKLLLPATSRTAATNIEAATDSIQAWLDFFARPCSTLEQQKGFAILGAIVTTWTTTLQYGSNAKRNHQHFCSNVVPSLLRALHTLSFRGTHGKAGSARHGALLDTVRQIAAESLFTEDVQRSLLQVARQAQGTNSPSCKHTQIAATGVVSQLCSSLQDPQLSQAAYSSLSTIGDLLWTKLSRSEALHVIISSSNITSGTVREAQLALVRKTMLSQWYFPLLPHLCTCASTQAPHVDRAAAIRGVLNGIERHSLYTLGCDEAEDWRLLFSALFESLRNELREIATDSSPTAQAEKADIFACLTSLWRLEKSVVEDDLTCIFALVGAQRVSKPALWLAEQLSPATLAALDMFRAVAAINVRFRTIPSLVNTIIASLQLTADLVAKTDDASLSSSLFMSQTFLTEFAKLCHDSITAMQVPELIQRLSSLAQRLNSISQSSATPKASKKQRTSHGSPSKTDNVQTEGTNVWIAHLEIAAQVVQSVNLAPTLRARCSAAAEELHKALILPCIDVCLSSHTVQQSASIYGVAAAALRVRQALLSEKWRYDPSEPVKLDGSLPTESLTSLEEAFDERADTLLELLSHKHQDDPDLCQLQFQIVQGLLQRAERDLFLGLKESRYCRLLAEDKGPLCGLIRELPLSGGSQVSAWTGCANQIRSRHELMQTLWMAIVTRWAPLFEAIAAREIFEVLAHTLVATAQPSLQRDDVQSAMRYMTSTALRNASFLELANWRKHIIATIQKELASPTLERRLASTAVLCVTPSEWVNKTARGPMLKALLALDRDLVAAQQKRKAAEQVATVEWIELRRLLASVQEAYATEANVSDDELLASLEAFWSSQVSDANLQHAWERASLAAIRTALGVLFSRGKANAATLERLFSLAKQVRHEATAEIKDDSTRITLKMRAAQEMFTILSAVGADHAELQTEAGAARTNLDAIMNVSSTRLETISDVEKTLDVLLYHLGEVRLLVRATGKDGNLQQETAQTLSRAVVRSVCTVFGRVNVLTPENEATKLVRPAADVALELLRCMDMCGRAMSDSNIMLSACLAYSALIASLPGLKEQRRVGDGLQRIVSRLEAQQYDTVLSKLLNALGCTASANIAVATVSAKEAATMDGDEAALIGTIGLVLGSAPEATSKVARTHLSNWLAILSGSNATGGGGRIKLRSMVACISALDLVCSHHAMLLRTQDLGAVLQLFSTVTGPSMCDEPLASVVETKREELDGMRSKLFGGIVSTLSSLMRLRQDLVVGFLPQVGLLLARLITLFRRLGRHASNGEIQASGSQRRSLRRDLPAWLDPVLVTPLRAHHEARALSRLVSNVMAKSVSLKHRSSDAPGTAVKAESLARPLSKHATYMLVAYLKSLTAQGSVVPADVRAELEVGMMTICEIMGHHQRDAAMSGLLDSAGKVLMKRIWSEFEKQRYKGQ